MKAKKEMTIDDLAVIVKKGFQEVGDTMATKEMAKSLVDNLAVTVKKGFQEVKDTMATKEMAKGLVDDLAGMVQKEFQEVRHTMATKDMLKIVVDDMGLIRDDIRDIKISLGPLVRMMAALDTDMQHLMTRVARLEQKAGLVK